VFGSQSEAFSIRRLGGSRWRLRTMNIYCAVVTDEMENAGSRVVELALKPIN
jgi:hypothetical protein